MEDTLRYFFSAVFQGFAAIITLGSMFYVFYKQRISDRLFSIESELRKLTSVNVTTFNADFSSGTFLKQVEDLLSTYEDELENTAWLKIYIKNFDDYSTVKKYNDSLFNELKKVLNPMIFILGMSLISLFLVGYHIFINWILILCGILTIILSILSIVRVRRFIYKVVESS